MTELTQQAQATLTDIDGIGAVSAATIIGALGSIDRFASHDALASFAGQHPGGSHPVDESCTGSTGTAISACDTHSISPRSLRLE